MQGKMSTVLQAIIIFIIVGLIFVVIVKSDLFGDLNSPLAEIPTEKLFAILVILGTSAGVVLLILKRWFKDINPMISGVSSFMALMMTFLSRNPDYDYATLFNKLMHNTITYNQALMIVVLGVIVNILIMFLAVNYRLKLSSTILSLITGDLVYALIIVHFYKLSGLIGAFVLVGIYLLLFAYFVAEVIVWMFILATGGYIETVLQTSILNVMPFFELIYIIVAFAVFYITTAVAIRFLINLFGNKENREKVMSFVKQNVPQNWFQDGNDEERW